jgi:hypothetical protein
MLGIDELLILILLFIGNGSSTAKSSLSLVGGNVFLSGFFFILNKLNIFFFLKNKKNKKREAKILKLIKNV